MVVEGKGFIIKDRRSLDKDGELKGRNGTDIKPG